MPFAEVKDSIRKCRFEGEDNVFSTSIFKLPQLFRSGQGDLISMRQLSHWEKSAAERYLTIWFAYYSQIRCHLNSWSVTWVLFTYVCKELNRKSTFSTFKNTIKSINGVAIQKASDTLASIQYVDWGINSQIQCRDVACYNRGQMQSQGNSCSVHKEGSAQPWINRNIYSN